MAGCTVDVRLYDNETFGDEACPLGSPHRHDHHELFWTTSGNGRHLLDGQPVTAGQHSLVLVPRGRIHQFEQARNIVGACIRFDAELLDDQTAPGLLYSVSEPSTVRIAAEDVAPLDSVIRALAFQAQQSPQDQASRHLLLAVLAWFNRSQNATPQGPLAQPPDEAHLVQRFTTLLERDFADHHDVGHYAEALHVSPRRLRRVVTASTGQPPRRLITERVLLEGARLLRFTNKTVAEISTAIGMRDPLYFSRSFKRHYGRSPLAYRQGTDNPVPDSLLSRRWAIGTRSCSHAWSPIR